MRDVRERAAVDEGRIVLQRLHEVRRHRVPQQHRHRPRRLDLLGAHQLARPGLTDNDVAESPLQVGEVAGETEDRHDLGGDDDVETVLAREPVCDPAERGDDRSQRPVVHVETAAPGDAAQVDAEFVAPIDVIVDHRGEQVVGGADRVEIAGEMEVDVLHRHDLGIAAAGRAAFHPEAGAEARLAQTDDRFLADMVQRVAEPDGRCRLAFAGRGRRDRGDEDQLAVRPVLQRRDIIEVDFRLVAAVGRHGVVGNPEFAGDLADRAHRRRLGDLDVG